MKKKQIEISELRSMQLATAAGLYGAKLSTLQKMAVRGELPAVKVGLKWYVTPETMDSIFRPAIPQTPAKETRTRRVK